MHKLFALNKAWSERAKLGEKTKQRDLLAFLPAILEIQETPPSPLAKWTARSLIAMFIIAIAWTFIGQVDVVSSAEGKIIPSDRVKKIQPLEKAVVSKILVAEGDTVIAGQPLVELDATLTNAEGNRLTGELADLKQRLSVASNFLNYISTQTDSISDSDLNLRKRPLKIDGNDRGTFYDQLLLQYWQEYKSQLLVFASNLRKAKAELASTSEVVLKLQKTLPIITTRSKTMGELYKKSYATETDYLVLEQERIATEQDLAAEKEHLKQLLEVDSEIREQLNLYKAQTTMRYLQSITELSNSIAALNQELTKAEDRNARQVLYSPVAGEVQQLTIATVGGVVTAAEQLMLIVPSDENLEVEVFLENIDVGFVKEGMPAEVKIHTFPFTKYGVVDGEVISVSDDAIVDEKKGLIYAIRIKMKRNTLDVSGTDIQLIPGMAVTAEMKTDTRRLIEFVASPLIRYRKESLRER